MGLTILNEPAPLVTDPDGVVRVGGTRVRLDTIVFAFNEGAKAEEIFQQYPAVSLCAVYATITYYLQHRDSVDAYVRDRKARQEEVRRLNELRFDPAGIRERLLRRAGQTDKYGIG